MTSYTLLASPSAISSIAASGNLASASFDALLEDNISPARHILDFSRRRLMAAVSFAEARRSQLSAEAQQNFYLRAPDFAA